MREFSIYCGLDTNGLAVDARQLALDIAAKHFPNGHSINEIVGRWQVADGSVITEQTIVITWLSDGAESQLTADRDRVSQCAADYKHAANQEAVMITCKEVDAVFV